MLLGTSCSCVLWLGRGHHPQGPEGEEEGEDEEEVATTSSAPVNDLPWDDKEEEPAPKKNYALQSKPKSTKADKFDALFEDEDEN